MPRVVFLSTSALHAQKTASLQSLEDFPLTHSSGMSNRDGIFPELRATVLAKSDAKIRLSPSVRPTLGVRPFPRPSTETTVSMSHPSIQPDHQRNSPGTGLS